ncbi:IucA/IucC family protein, partial [Streptococcus pyogenes]
MPHKRLVIGSPRVKRPARIHPQSHNVRTLDERDDYLIMAVHPWQMQRYIYSQYASLLASGDIIDLGTSEEQWRPQQ